MSASGQNCGASYAERISHASSRQQVLSLTIQAEKALYTPDSDSYNEDLFIQALEAALRSPLLTDDDKQRPTALLNAAMKNRPGMTAADISYTIPDGNNHKLSDLSTRFIILFFNDPECDDCATLKQAINENELLKNLVADKMLTILGIYPYDDETLWRHTPYPQIMVNGWDKDMQIEETESYQLSKIPTLYLLGENHKVLLKTATLPAIIQYLEKRK